jgi:fucose permease
MHRLTSLSLFVNYFVFAMLLNSVGTVILQVQRNFDISKSDASLLEGFKDIPIAVASFIFASFLPRIGLRHSMLLGLGLVSVTSFCLPFVGQFWYFKLLFFCIGISFAFIKVSTFATIGLITDSEKSHASFMGYIEAVFMAGILCGQFMMSAFIDDNDPKSESWFYAYWVLATLSIIAFILMYKSKIDERDAKIENRQLKEEFSDMLGLMIIPLTIVFILSVFCYVLIEQSFQTWFPTFYKEILKVPSTMAIQAGAVLAGAAMVGRLLSGYVLKKVSWIAFLSFCIIMVILLINIALSLSSGVSSAQVYNWFNAPFVVYLLPLIGLFLSPIYPTINSVILSALPKNKHSAMSGLIVVFSALGGTTGSMITGHVFERFDGSTAFYLTLIPLGFIAVLLILLYRIIKKNIIPKPSN